VKLTSIPMLMAATIVLPGAAAETLEEVWNLEEPSFNYTDSTFVMTYRFSNAIQTTAQTKGKIYLYGNTAEADSVENCMQGDGLNSYDPVDPVLVLSESDFVTSGDAAYDKGQKETVKVALDTLKVANDPDVWSDSGNGVNLIKFCVRYGLYTGDHEQASSYEVNFLESLIELTVDLKGDFTVTGISVAPKDKLKRTANQDYNLEAFQCTGKTATGGVRRTDNNQFSQGAVITVCVQPDETAIGDNIYMKQVEYFEYFLLDAESGAITDTSPSQLAISEGSPMFGLTNIDNCQGEVACKIETILFAIFYTRTGTVTGKGSGTMQFGTTGADGDINNRKLRGSAADEQQQRTLQDVGVAAASEFDVNFQIASNDAFQGNSGASSSMTFLALVGAAAGALML
jgi:hypothetical protein